MEQRKEEIVRAGQGAEQATVWSAGMTAAQRSDARVYRLVVMAMLIGLGVVISPILRVEGMCPMAHLINITGAVLLGPWYSFVIAAIIGILRMTLMGIPPLALTGAVFGATLSGILYRLSGGRLWTAVVGEIIGTGLIGAMASYPVMTLLYGRTGLTWMFYVPSFIMGTLIGGTIAFFLLSALRRRGTLRAIQHKLGVQRLDRLPHA
ncbi:MAG: energy coupling factor transporter S component ThiW [Succiniclasticum sp.]|nr:energy coupling factor transporter S component ThiW [Succiniclasticum sp.]